MAFRLNRDQPIGPQLRRLIQREMTAAVALLGTAEPGDAAIHEARVCVKKSRAILRLLQPALCSDYRRETKQLRGAGDALSTLRDADATEETLNALRNRYPTAISSAALAGIAGGLRARKQVARARSKDSLATARRGLADSARSTPSSVERVATVRRVRKGMVRGYRRARRALRQVAPDSDVARFHLWRRRVKDHWYQIRLVERFSPALRTRAKALRRLEALLGDDHNLALLRDLILAAPDRYGSARSTALVLGCIARRQAVLRRRALDLGHRLFPDPPGAFARSLEKWWRA
jgi:CHAD domain-containing protein